MIPDTFAEFLTPKLEALLDALPEGEHREKMEETVLLLAYVDVYAIPRSHAFEDARACNQRIWYQKWQNIPAIQAIYAEAVRIIRKAKRQARARAMAQYADEYELAVAKAQVSAVTGLEKTALEQRNRDGAEASKILLVIPEDKAALATRLGMGKGALPVEMQGDSTLKIEFGPVDPALLEALGDDAQPDFNE